MIVVRAWLGVPYESLEDDEELTHGGGFTGGDQAPEGGRGAGLRRTATRAAK
jgi:hypothetical protein